MSGVPVTERPRPVLELRGVGMRFGERVALDDVDLTVHAGQVFGLLGHNAAGKTTLLRVALGLLSPTAGEVRVLGHRVPRDLRDALARVGALVEEPRFHDGLSGRQNLTIAAAARGGGAGARIDEVLRRAGLEARAGDRVSGYSQGMRQRLGIARCLLPDPSLVVLDEPLNGLDPGGVIELRGLLGELVAEGRTVLLSSHALSEVELVCDSVAVIDAGRLLATSSVAELRGAKATLVLRVAEPRRAQALLSAGDSGCAMHGEDLHVALPADPRAARAASAATISALVAADLDVFEARIEHPSLEDRFLQITGSLQEAL